MNSKLSFAEDYYAYLLTIAEPLQNSELDDLELYLHRKEQLEFAGGCQVALSPLDWWTKK